MGVENAERRQTGGQTFIGWVLALIWSLTASEKSQTIIIQQKSGPIHNPVQGDRTNTND
jgi:hypothetical protein